VSLAVSKPMFPSLAKTRPPIIQYSLADRPEGLCAGSLYTITRGAKALSPSSMYSHVRSHSTTCASASITAIGSLLLHYDQFTRTVLGNSEGCCQEGLRPWTASVVPGHDLY